MKKPTGRESCARCAVPLHRRGQLSGQLFWPAILASYSGQLFWLEPTFQPHVACDVVHEFLSQKLPLFSTLDENV